MGNLLTTINDFVWGLPLVILVLLSGLYFTVRMKFPQFRRFKSFVKASTQNESSSKGLNQVQSFVLTAARTVGVGNIAGMAAGIHFGGPGSIFWLWILALFGSATVMIEGILAQTYKKEINGEYRGGPSYYMEKAFKNKKIGRIFALTYAVVGVFAVTFLMPGVQSYNITQGIELAFGVDQAIGGLILAALLAVVIIGGIKRIGQFAQRFSPIIAVLYLLIALIVIIFNYDKIIPTFGLIFKSAFGVDAVFGAIVGQSISWGIKRGVFANEIGVGTSAITSATSEVKHPVTQGMIGGLSVFVGTFFVSTMTALMILITNSYNVVGPDGNMIVEYLPGTAYGNEYIISAIDSVLPNLGAPIIAIAVLSFSSVALLAHYLYAESNLIFLIGERKKPVFVLQIAFIASVFLGSVISADAVWTMGDLAFGLMAWINVITLFVIGNQGVKIFADYEEQEKQNKEPVFDPDKLNLLEADKSWKQNK